MRVIAKLTNGLPATRWTDYRATDYKTIEHRATQGVLRSVTVERAIVKEQLETLVGQMVERGILLEEAVIEFEKKFIKRALERANGNQSRAAKFLGIHRNTLSRKVGEYKITPSTHRRSK